MKIDVLENFTKFTGKHLCQSLCLNKVAGLRPATLLKKKIWYRCFPRNSAKFLRTPFLQNFSGQLLLQHMNTIDILTLLSSLSNLLSSGKWQNLSK